MDLTELQVQLRLIEGHISALQTEIERMKPQPEDEKQVVYDRINRLVAKYPLLNK